MTDAAASLSSRVKYGGELCGAIGCGNARNKPSCKGKPFFSFPKDEPRCQHWIQNSERHDLKELSAEEISRKRIKLCCDHFESNQFTVPSERKRLNWNAVPTVFVSVTSKGQTNDTVDQLDVPTKIHKPFSSDVNSPSKSTLKRFGSKKRDRMKTPKPVGKFKTERRTAPTCDIACLVCRRPFKTTNNSLIPNLPFCKGCKNIYFQLVAKQPFSSQPPKCSKGGKCRVHYRFLGSKHWCSSCHVRKFQSILRRFDALQVKTGCNPSVDKPPPGLRAEEKPDMNPRVLIEKLSDGDLISIGLEPADTSRSAKAVQGEKEKRVLPPSKSSPDKASPLSNHLKTHKTFSGLKKNSKAKNPFMESVDIYVFDCGHACSVCNSAQAKEWLKDCGFHTTLPSTADAVAPTVNQSPNCLSPSAQDSQVTASLDSVGLSKQQSDMPQQDIPPPNMPHPAHSQVPHIHCSSDHGAAVSQSLQTGGPPGKFFIPLILPASFVSQMSNTGVLYGNVPTTVLSPDVINASTSHQQWQFG